MRCANCRIDNPADAAFCEQCGRRLEPACPGCGGPVNTGARFCRKCGTNLGTSAAPPEQFHDDSSSGATSRLSVQQLSSDAVEGERKTITALFADIKGSTELLRELDPEEARAIIDPVLGLMIDAVRRYDGYVVQSAGDGIFAVFGAPVAHEDHPQRAVHAALHMQQELRRYTDRPARQGNRRLKPAPLEIRIGINTGDVVLRTMHIGGHTEYTPVGYAANLAERMQAVAPPGGIVVSAEMQPLVEGYFELRELGPTKVKGVDQPLNIYQVIHAGGARGHFELAKRRGFVGRERETGELHRALELARSGRGQVVAIVADPGTGKSRLLHEFKSELPQPAKVIEGHSVSHGKNSAWLPLLELMRSYFGFNEAHDEANRREKVLTRLTALDPKLRKVLPYLLALLGTQEPADSLAQMDPRIRRQRTLDALKRVVVREALNQPVVVIFEDLHWIDEETQAFLDVLADGIPHLRALLLVSYRPEYHHGWSNKSYYSQLRLNALEPDNAEVMLEALLGRSAELNPLKRLIIQRTEGNPFFIEETVQALFDQGVLVRDGSVKLTRSVEKLRLPATIQGVLEARIDRLPPDQKELLQTLAVIGRVSQAAIVRQVAPSTEFHLPRIIADLQAAEFIYEQQSASGSQFAFKHALTQEVAYKSVLLKRRKPLHERTAQSIETIFASNLVDHYSELAHHYRLSGNSAKAIDYMRLAGVQAVERSANTEAAIYFTSALDLLMERADTPERAADELTLQVVLAPALQAIKGWAASEVEYACSRILELCKQLGESPQIYSALFGLQAFYVH